MPTTLIRLETKKMNIKVIELIEEAIQNHKLASETIKKNDSAMAIKILENDKLIDALYLDIEADLEFIVAKAPVDKDLRRTLAYLSIVKEIERIADYAKHIAKFVIKNNNSISSSSVKRISTVHDMFFAMLTKLKEVLKVESVVLALKVAKEDIKVDEKVYEIRKEIVHSLSKKQNEDDIDQRIFVANVINSLERACDHIVNICEMIIYIDNGKHTLLG